MIYQETTQVRRIVGKLEHGEKCVERLTSFFEEHGVRAAELRAVGRLSEVEVVRFDADRGDYEEIYAGEGAFDLLQLSGNVSTLGDEIVVRLHGLLAADGPVGPQLIAGQLQSATAAEFEFVAEMYEDLELERQIDRETGMLQLQSIQRRDTAGDASTDGPAMEGQSMSWDDAAESTEEAEPPEAAPEARSTTDSERVVSESAEESEVEQAPDDEEDDESSPYEGVDLEAPELASGDIIDHPKLGRCRVIKIEEDKYAHIRLPQGKIRKLSLNVVEITYSGEEDGHNLFEAQVNA